MIIDGIYTCEYIGNNHHGYIPGNSYTIEIEKDNNYYNITPIESDAKFLIFSSEISLRRNFKIND